MSAVVTNPNGTMGAPQIGPSTGNTSGLQQYVVQAALSAYADEAYTSEMRLSGTGIVGGAGQIDVSTETYTGQMRWYKPSSLGVNTATLTNAGEGGRASFDAVLTNYVKRVATYGHTQVNMQMVVSQQDGLAKIARDFGMVRAQDEHDSVIAVLRGVAAAEARHAGGGSSVTATRGIQTFDSISSANATFGGSTNTGRGVLDSETTGYYIDFNNATTRSTLGEAGSDPLTLISTSNATYGAIRGERLFTALGMGMQDYESDYVYMVTSPEVMAHLRSANLVDQTTITEGNLEFQTIFGGKFRLVMTRANQGDLNGVAGINSNSGNTTFLVKPGMVNMAMLNVPVPVEIDRQAATYAGGGSTDIFYRWGYVAHAGGYSWVGSQAAFADKAGTQAAGSATSINLGDGNWQRMADVLNLGILPIFHA